MSTVTVRETNQHFSRILDAAARGEEVTITRRGKPVAKLAPIEVQDPAETERRTREREAALAFIRKGVVGGAQDPWTRDEIYDDRLRHFWSDDD